MRSAAIVLAAALGLSGCTLMAPEYGSSVENLQALRLSGDSKVAVAQFSAKDNDESKVNEISLRGSSLVSPYGSYARYLQESLTRDLRDTGRLDPQAKVSVSGVLLKNALDGSGIETGTADMECRFTVQRGERISYDKVHSAHHEWPSAFAGATAIPAAQQNYPVTVQKLLNSLYSDPEFTQAIQDAQ